MSIPQAWRSWTDRPTKAQRIAAILVSWGLSADDLRIPVDGQEVGRHIEMLRSPHGAIFFSGCEADAARAGGEEHAHARVVMEVDEILSAPFLALLAGEERGTQPVLRQHPLDRPGGEAQHTAPLAEDDNLALLLDDELGEDLPKLQELGAFEAGDLGARRVRKSSPERGGRQDVWRCG